MQRTFITDKKGTVIRSEGPDGEMALLVGFRAKEGHPPTSLLGEELGMFVDRLDHTMRYGEHCGG